MRTRSTVIMAVLACLAGPVVAAGTAGAQVPHTRTGPTGTVAGIAPAPPPSPAPGQPGSDGDRGREPERHRQLRAPVMLSDGRVFADFGRGYEQVVRACGSTPAPMAAAGAVVAGGTAAVQPAVSQPVVTQPAPGMAASLPYTPAVPGQQAGLQPAQPGISTAAQSCWATDARGQIFIARP